MQRTLKDYFIITAKGLAMGAADAVPGVSGGTIAFISGIYEELISTLSAINFSAIKTLFKEGFSAFWKKINGTFLLALLIGIAISFISFMKLAKYLMEYHPIPIWSFFFGLIVASVFFVAIQIKEWNYKSYLAILLGIIIAYYITTLPAMASTNHPLFLFFAGAIAICAMILPGISGSYILIVLGAYQTLSTAIANTNITILAIFALGAILGLLSFSRILKWLFKKYNTITLAFLTGFIIGSLNKVWPWKRTLTVLDNLSSKVHPFSEISSLGTLSVYQQQIGNFESYKTVLEESISPNTYTLLNHANAQLGIAIALMVIGFSTIFILERLGSVKK